MSQNKKAKENENDLETEMLDALDGINPETSVDPTKYLQTDAGNAQLLVAMFGAVLRYVEAWRTWMFWNGQLWVQVSDIALTRLATQATENMIKWVVAGLRSTDNSLYKHALASQKKERLLAMIHLAKGDERVRAEPSLFDADKWLLGCGAVTFDLRKQAFYPARKEDFITKSTGVIPSKDMPCPNWLAFLDWAFGGDHETIDHIQRVAGYALTGDVSEEALFALFGGGSNGKTTFVMTLFTMLGDYAGKVHSSVLLQPQGEKGTASPDVAELHGKRLVIVSETDENCSLAEAQVKAITSNEPIVARKLHRDPFTFMPTHKTMLMTNHPPFVKGTDDGIWRRMNIIGFNEKMGDKEKVKSFREKKLAPELPAILTWAIRGYRKWQKDGLKPSIAVKTAKDAYRSDMDLVAQWLEEKTTADPDARVTRAEAYSNYKEWAQAHGAPALGMRRFKDELHARGYRTVKSHGVRMFEGLRIEWRNFQSEMNAAE